MIDLSPRMKAIAGQIQPGQSVADIGTDHACIPIYLYQNKISSKIILTDSKEGPLQKAGFNLKKAGLSEALSDIRIGNGLSVLEPEEVDVVIIAGMGGLLITDILSADISKSMTFSHYILQPRTASPQLRAWLSGHNFSIVGEHLAREGNRICEIIKAKPSTGYFSGEKFLNEMDFEIPPFLTEFKDPLLCEFLNGKILKTQAVLTVLNTEKSVEAKERELILQNRLRTLKERKALL